MKSLKQMFLTGACLALLCVTTSASARTCYDPYYGYYRCGGGDYYTETYQEPGVSFSFGNGYYDSSWEVQQLGNIDNIYSIANGTLTDKWEKEKLGKELIDKVFQQYNGDENMLKELLFKIMECNYKSKDPKSWPNIN